MKLEKYTKIKGALRTPAYKEVLEELSLTKGIKLAKLENITVSIKLENGDSHSFDGDETSQNRLNRAYNVVKYKKQKGIDWKDSNNELVFITDKEILNILAEALKLQTSIWTS